MRVHTSYSLGTHTVQIEASGLPDDSVSAIKLSMGKACVLVSVALQQTRDQSSGTPQVAVSFSASPGTRSSGDMRHGVSVTDANENLGEWIRQLIGAVITEDTVPEMRVMVRVLSDDPAIAPDVPVLQALGVALHRLKVLNAPLMTVVRAACVNARLILMPSTAQRSASDLHFLAAFTRSGPILLRAQAQDMPNALLIGAVAQVQAGLQPVFQALEALVGEPAQPEGVARQLNIPSSDPDHVDSNVARAVLAASQFSSPSARRMALQSISTRWQARLLAHGETVQPGQIECTVKRMARSSLRQRILTGGKRFDGRAASNPGSMEMELQAQADGRRAVLLNSGRSQTSIVATPKCVPDQPDHDEAEARALQDIFLQFDPRKHQGAGPSSETGDRDPNAPSDDFFPFVSMVLEPVMQPHIRVAAYAKPMLDNGYEMPASAMTGVGGACLAMLSAGAQIKAWVAGVDLGVMAQGDASVVLVDPLPGEDALLDANLKVAGTFHGLTAVQMCAHTPGMTHSMLEASLAQAQDVRRSRIAEMRRALASATASSEELRPKRLTTNIDPGLTHELMVRRRNAIAGMCEATCADIHVDRSGLVTITAPDEKRLRTAHKQFDALASEILKTRDAVEAVVTEVIECFGVRLATPDGKTALLHASRMSRATLNEGLDVGDTVEVRMLGRDVLGSYTAEMPADAESRPIDPSSLV